MHVFHRDQVIEPGDALQILLRWLGTLLVLCLLALSCSCGSAKMCQVYYRYDGGTVRPYYKAVECPGDPTRVDCDDEQPLPTDHCR